ncbi:hypothetical protein [Pyxidicoccus trucidator]|uniref:hypothetical protein n=1 Tax=Pyxidicoccus trucidator TaxID=2709662 RepID=UPI0013D9E119|nr:hypothetical protein [Pyxidicoccus trucidator]
MSALLAASCLLGSLLQGLSPSTAEDVVATVLLDAGAEPRRALRLVHRPGWAQRARLSVASEVDTVSGAGPEGELRTEYGPEVVVPLRLSLPVTGAVDDSARYRLGPGRLVPPDPWAIPGEARYRLRVGRPEVRAVDEDGMEAALALAEALGALSGRDGEAVLSGTGALVEAWLDLRGGVSSQLVSQVRAALSSHWLATPPFPEEPVGPGARWTVARAHEPGSLSVITYELLELRGFRGRVRFEFQARTPGGSREPVAEGELRFDLRRPLPERLEVVFTSRTPRGRGGSVVRRTRVTLEAGGLQPLSRRVRVAVPP